MRNVKLWLDDLRPVPAGWTGARSVNEAIATLLGAQEDGVEVTHASLDHDLGEFSSDGGDGATLTDWMAFHDTWPTQGLRIHSANPVGVATMLATVDRYAPYRTRTGSHRGTWDAAELDALFVHVATGGK